MGARFYYNSDLSTTLIVIAQFGHFVLTEMIFRRTPPAGVENNAIADVNENVRGTTSAADVHDECFQCDADDTARNQRTVKHAPGAMRCDV